MKDLYDGAIFGIKSVPVKPRENKEFKELFDRPSQDQFLALYNDIRVNGLNEPIELNQHGDIVDGYTRFEICEDLKEAFPDLAKYKILHFENGPEALLYSYQKNQLRRQLTEAQRVANVLKMKPTFKKLAAARKQHRSERTEAFADFYGKTTDHMATLAGVPPTTMLKYEKVQEKDPKLFDQVLKGDIAVTKAYNETMIKENKKLPKSKVPKGIYNVIVYDPAWPHDNKVAGGSGTSGASQQYREESIEEMCNHPIKKMIAKDAILWLWCLPTFHEEAVQVVKALGFDKIKTKIYWDKMQMSMGFNFRNQVEELLVCTRGNVKAFWLTDQTNIIHAKSSKNHSEKPEEIWKIIEKASKKGLPMTKLSKVELNSRNKRDGWVTVGNQIPYDLRFWVSRDLDLKNRAEIICELWNGKKYDEEKSFGKEIGVEFDKEIITKKMKQIFEEVKEKYPELLITPKLIVAPWHKTDKSKEVLKL